ncbi:MAG: DUF6531 domain-containing protein [Anaeromyxobacter sp.]
MRIKSFCGFALLALLALPLGAWAQQTSQPRGDVADAFFRFTGTENKPFASELPGETVDPFTGTLHIVQTDVVLPGHGGLDFRIIRSYSSKIWGRADLLDSEPLLAEKEASILGYGWSLHFGRLRNPWATGKSDICGGDFPVFEEPDGTSHVFYPHRTLGNVFVSKDYWRMERNCAAAGAGGTCVWSSSGLRYDFLPSSTVDGVARLNTFQVGGTAVLPAVRVVDPFGNQITYTYIASTGAPESVKDTYERIVEFRYSVINAERRLQSILLNGKAFTYGYETLRPEDVAGHTGRFPLPGPRRFLTQVTPPAGPSSYYSYWLDTPVGENQYALRTITYPAGGSTTYNYGAVAFFTGLETVSFATVTSRVTGGRGIAAGEWTYEYRSPGYKTYDSTDPEDGSKSDLHVTTITRPDGLHDTYTLYGFGWAADQDRFGYTYAVGLTRSIARADRAEVEYFDWDLRIEQPVSDATFSAPVYSTSCGAHFVADGGVYAPQVAHHWLMRDEDQGTGQAAWFQTDYSNFDAYGQALSMVETGYSGSLGDIPPVPAVRTTELSYFSAPEEGGQTLNMVRGKLLTQSICVSGDCFQDAWSYDEPGHPVHLEVKSGVATRFDHYLDGDSQERDQRREQAGHAVRL